MQITVAFVNLPNKNPKFGSIKSTDGIYYDIGAGAVSRYRKGMTFDAPVKERESGGKTYYSIPDSFDPVQQLGGTNEDYRTAARPQPNVPAQTWAQAQAPIANPAPPRPAGNGHTDKTPMQIFVTGIVGRAMGSGKFGIDDIPELTRKAREAWDLHG